MVAEENCALSIVFILILDSSSHTTRLLLSQGMIYLHTLGYKRKGKVPSLPLLTGFSSEIVLNLVEHPTLLDWNPGPLSLEASVFLPELIRPNYCYFSHQYYNCIIMSNCSCLHSITASLCHVKDMEHPFIASLIIIYQMKHILCIVPFFSQDTEKCKKRYLSGVASPHDKCDITMWVLTFLPTV